MGNRDEITQKYENWGLKAHPLNAQVIVDCDTAIKGLEETLHNLRVISTFSDNEAKHALIKELAVLSSNATAMLERYCTEAYAEVSVLNTPF